MSRFLFFAREKRPLRGVLPKSVLAWSACLLFLAAGCAERNPPPPLTPEELAAADSVTALLERIDETALRSAFQSVSTRTHTQRLRTGQFDEDGTLLASRAQEVRYDAEGPRTIYSESSGTFDFGYLRRFVLADDPEETGPAASDLSEYIIPEDPPYAVARNREAWRYEFAPDSMLSDRPVRVVRITARPGYEVSRSIRRVCLYLDRTSDRLVGIYVERVHVALWFREESAFFLSMVRLPAGTWAPDHARFETRIKLLFRPAQRFRSSAEYYDFGEMAQAPNRDDPNRTG